MMKKITLTLIALLCSLSVFSTRYLVEQVAGSWTATTGGTVVDLSNPETTLNQWFTDMNATFATGDEVWIAQGTYNLTGTITVSTGIVFSVYGGFAGDETSIDDRVKGANAWNLTNATILDGNNSCQIIVATGGTHGDGSAGRISLFDGLTMTNGSTSANGGAFTGNGSITIQSCQFVNNTTTGNGGALYITGGQFVTVDGCLFSGNTAVTSGGGAYMQGDRIDLHNSTFEYNTLTNTGDGHGGGLYFEGFDNDGYGSITNSIIRGNSGKWFGGGLSVRAKKVENCIIVNNAGLRSGSDTYKNSILIRYGTPFINCTIASNDGGIRAQDGNVDAVYSNTIYWHTGVNSFENVSGTKFTFTNCALYPVLPAESWVQSASEDNIPLANINTNASGPNFVNPTTFDGVPSNDDQKAELAAADWSLTSNSPCVDAGSASGTATDILGYARPNGNGIDIGAYEYYAATAFWSASAATNDWTIPANWVDNSMPSPAGTTDVTILTNAAKYYPIVPTNGAAVKSIVFEADAEIGNQHLLSVTDEATVQYNLPTGRWNMIAVPVDKKEPGNITINDFHFNNTPETYVKILVPDENSYIKWEPKTPLDYPFKPGDGFAFWIAENSIPLEKVRDANKYPFAIKGSLAGDQVKKELSFGSDDLYGDYPFAIAGNPFMTTIDFEDLAGAHDVISSNYLIWTGQAFSGYTLDGIYGDITNITGLNQYIAPLQSFIVEKSNLNITDKKNLVLNLTSIQETAAANKPGLKNTTQQGDKIDIVANNDLAEVLTFIAKRDNAQSARKLISGNLLPDIYTLNGEKAFGAQFITSDEITIPIGISTTYTGEMTLAFSGMDNYDSGVEITLLDNAAEDNKEIDLTNLSSYIYPFTHTPNADNTPVENRFQLAFSPKTITGINPAEWEENISVYYKENYIYGISSLTNQIKQIAVHDIQGRLIYLDNNVNASSHTINVPENASDIYIVKLITEKKVKNVKVIKH